MANAVFAEQPVTALVYSEAPVASPVAFTVTNLGVNNTAPMQAAIAAALADMFLRLGNVGGTLAMLAASIWILVITVTKGTTGSNRYGPDPLSEPADVF